MMPPTIQLLRVLIFLVIIPPALTTAGATTCAGDTIPGLTVVERFCPQSGCSREDSPEHRADDSDLT
jgi:hypothetical protein